MSKSIIIKTIAAGVLVALALTGCTQNTPNIPQKITKDTKFETNQKYICTKVQAKKTQKLFNDSTEFFIDENNILHTNDKENNQLKSFIKSVYKNNYSAIRLEISDKLYMKRKLVKGKTRGIMDVYTCQKK